MTLRVGHLEFDHVVYDGRGDVLYLSVGKPREPARQVATPEGHVVRYGHDGGIIGLTLVNAKWLSERDGGIDLPIRVLADDLAPALG